jgi:hypothetical protein
LVRQVLEDRLAAGDIPDIGLLRGAKRIAIRSNLPISRLTLGAGALPVRDGYEFRLITTTEAQAEADRTKTNTYFLAVDRVEISGDRATMWIGADLVTPSDPKIVKMCCCERSVGYRRVENRWVFEGWGNAGACR